MVAILVPNDSLHTGIKVVDVALKQPTNSTIIGVNFRIGNLEISASSKRKEKANNLLTFESLCLLC